MMCVSCVWCLCGSEELHLLGRLDVLEEAENLRYLAHTAKAAGTSFTLYSKMIFKYLKRVG
jgi:hypothetical protein